MRLQQRARTLNHQLIAEGVETAEQVESVLSKDCDLMQVYDFYKLLGVNDIESRLATRST